MLHDRSASRGELGRSEAVRHPLREEVRQGLSTRWLTEKLRGRSIRQLHELHLTNPTRSA
jgi:hypothetical protein